MWIKHYLSRLLPARDVSKSVYNLTEARVTRLSAYTTLVD